MCHADLTSKIWEEIDNKLILKTDTVHTCPDFQKIWEFSTKRQGGLCKKKEEMVTYKLRIVD
jgi:hypothetical protein